MANLREQVDMHDATARSGPVSSGPTPPPETIAAVLPLPKTTGLTPEQVRGAACVWGGGPLDNGSAVDLGARSGLFNGVQSRWFPRGCQSCTRAAARRVYAVHARTCPRCRSDETGCGTLRALRRIALDGRA